VTDIQNTFKYKISGKSIRWEPNSSMRADRQTDTTKLLVAFRNFAKAPENNISVKANPDLIELLDPKHGRPTLIRNVLNYLPFDPALTSQST
jgi:hypothetical protein